MRVRRNWTIWRNLFVYKIYYLSVHWKISIFYFQKNSIRELKIYPTNDVTRECNNKTEKPKRRPHDFLILYLNVILMENFQNYYFWTIPMKRTSLFLETAINIGYSCRLFNDEMELFIVDGNTQDQVEFQLDQCYNSFSDGPDHQQSDRNSMATSVVRFRWMKSTITKYRLVGKALP